MSTSLFDGAQFRETTLFDSTVIREAQEGTEYSVSGKDMHGKNLLGHGPRVTPKPEALGPARWVYHLREPVRHRQHLHPGAPHPAIGALAWRPAF
jgi:hypothetical protein